MSAQSIFAVACPACGTQFPAPVQQILDVRVDPRVKNHLLNGAANVAVCPRCGTGGSLNLPFIYHDPEKEVALLYLPANVADNEVERQREAGRLNRELLESMPQEERKGYLLQPETFLTMDSLIKRVLELENISLKDIERNQHQHQFLETFFTADEEAWPTLLEENADLLGEDFFGLLEYTMQMIGMGGGDPQQLEKLQRAYNYLVEETEIGQKLLQRAELFRSFSETPSIETLLDVLSAAPDEETVEILVQNALPMLNYAFFQKLLQRIEGAPSEAEKEHLLNVRRIILRIRDEIAKASKDIIKARAEFLQKLLNSTDPLKMARSHRSEIDDAFSFVLRSELEAAHKEENQQVIAVLQNVARVINQVMEETMPPEAVLVRRIMMVTSDEHIQKLLESNREILTPYFFQFLESLIASSQEMEDEEAFARLAAIHNMALSYAPERTRQQLTAPAEQPPPPLPSGPEQTTPSGLIIAKR